MKSIVRGHLYLASRSWQYAISSASSSGPGAPAAAQLDDALDLLAEVGMRDSEDRDVVHGGVADQYVLGLLRIHVDAA